MLRNLLAERFKLTVHWEQKVLPVYALVAAKNSLKLQPVPDDGDHDSESHRTYLEAKRTSMAAFAKELSNWTDRPVVDRTGLQGAYTFTLRWTPDDAEAKTAPLGEANTSSDEPPTLFTALQEQLGLKLENRKAPFDILVVDGMEKAPTEN